jgi:hypothetical protein
LLPDRGVCELLALQEMADSAPWATSDLRACFLRQLCDVGYHRLAVKQWKSNKAAVESSVASWAQIGRALVGLKRKPQARRFLADWRRRPGIEMWIVANYVLSFSGFRARDFRQLQSSCRDALASLQHDHCAKYLVHVEAEACSLLGEKEAFLQVWKARGDYFTGKLNEGEWFEKKREHLLTTLPTMARLLETGDSHEYRRMVRTLRWKHLFSSSATRGRQVNFRLGWIFFWLIWLLLQTFLNSHK